MERLSGLAGDSLLLACADGRWTRRRSGHRSVTEEVREAIFAVKAECGERARLSLAARHRLMNQYMRERFPAFPAEKMPSRWTFADVRKEWFGPGGARPRYGRTAQAAAEAGVSGRMVVHRPGQVLVLDSAPIPVKLRETVFGDAVTATLTLALDHYTHGLPAFRLTLQVRHLGRHRDAAAGRDAAASLGMSRRFVGRQVVTLSVRFLRDAPPRVAIRHCPGTVPASAGAPSRLMSRLESTLQPSP
ncbi:hypothetical protein ACFYXF_46615 [Streptomyces sp. NPDC002680]|uniref:hypothetical protein n=1 Tax=Streptomyces sp. NPDC002680 TaxID=3364659 RepID=UPI0036B7C042